MATSTQFTNPNNTGASFNYNALAGSFMMKVIMYVPGGKVFKFILNRPAEQSTLTSAAPVE